MSLSFKPSAWMVLLVPCLLQAQDKLQIRTNYYPVVGSTLREIRQSLNRSRPHSDTGSHDGLTIWKIDWRHSVSRQDNICRLSSFTTKTTIAVTLPLWQFPTNAPSDLVKTWRDYIVALGRHEQRHAQFAEAAAAEMHQRVDSIGPRSDCGVLQKEIDTVARGILQIYRQKEKAYDVQTRHGETQGATLLERKADGSGEERPGERKASQQPR